MSEQDNLLNFNDEEASGRYLIFYIGDLLYSVKLSYVLGIIQIQNVTKIPCVAPYVRGAVNLRGNVIPVVDARVKFGLDPKVFDARTCIVILEIDNVNIGIVVDTVCEVSTIKNTQLSTPPKNLEFCKRYLSSVFETELGLVLNLDFHKFFDDDLDTVRI